MQNQVRNRHFKLYLENNIFKYFLDYRFQQLILPYKTEKLWMLHILTRNQINAMIVYVLQASAFIESVTIMVLM